MKIKIWDIVDSVYPGVQIVATNQHQRRVGGIVSSAAQCAFAITLAVASSGTFAFTRGPSACIPGARVGVSAREPTWSVSRGLVAETPLLPIAVHTSLARKAQEEMTEFERDYPW